MDSSVVRSFEPRDRDSLLALWAEVFPDDPPRNSPASMIEQKLRVQPELLLVSISGEDLVGAVMAGFDGTRGWIHHLAVAETHRRLGIGTSLIEAAEEGLRRLGCPKVNLQVRAENTGVVAFYARNGYDTEPRVSMGKLLPPSA